MSDPDSIFFADLIDVSPVVDRGFPCLIEALVFVDGEPFGLAGAVHAELAVIVVAAGYFRDSEGHAAKSQAPAGQGVRVFGAQLFKVLGGMSPHALSRFAVMCP